MIQIIDNPPANKWNELLARPTIPSNRIRGAVEKILDAVRTTGDMAVKEYADQFDECGSVEMVVTQEEINESENKLETALKQAISLAKNNIEIFHRGQMTAELPVQVQPGILCWRKSVGIEKVGLYIPGGTAPLFSTLVMLGVPAILAGCEEIIICTPPQKNGTVHPAILFTAKLLGLRKIFRVGGVQAIAAMAYGTQTIPKVYKIFGPGNQWVTEAKKIIQQEGIAIDMPAGPSELAVYADLTAVPEYVAADLLSQCEHGADSQVILVTNSILIAEKVNAAVVSQLKKLPRREIAEKALKNSKIFLVGEEKMAMDLLNAYAPEHLILACANAEAIIPGLKNAGSVFLGNFAPESAGDYASGTNHTLPTNGYARAYSGLSTDSFVKKISFQQLTKPGLESIGQAVIEMACAEGLEAHAAAVQIRLQKTEK